MCQMYKLIPFKVEHIECMEVREHEQRFDIEQCKLLEDTLAFTCIIDGRILASGGLKLYRNKGAEIWLLPSVYMSQYSFKAARIVLNWINEMQDIYDIDRMETVSLNDKLHKRWLSFLGFEIEGIKKNYLYGQDFLMWGKTWE